MRLQVAQDSRPLSLRVLCAACCALLAQLAACAAADRSNDRVWPSGGQSGVDGGTGSGAAAGPVTGTTAGASWFVGGSGSGGSPSAAGGSDITGGSGAGGPSTTGGGGSTGGTGVPGTCGPTTSGNFVDIRDVDYDASSPSRDFSVTLDPGCIVPIPDKLDNDTDRWLWPIVPDGKLSVVPRCGSTSQWLMFWPESASYRTQGSSNHVEDQVWQNERAAQVFGHDRPEDTTSWDNGGSWLMSVFRIAPNELVGFYHAEHHWHPGHQPAWKSIAVTYSGDDGATWSPGKQVLTGHQPMTYAWGGVGDHAAVWDWKNDRWLIIFQDGYMHAAATANRRGDAGWRKMKDGGGFVLEGLGGGPPGRLKTTDGKELQGANPSIHWNTYLRRWVMVYHSWSPGELRLTASDDLLTWDPPRTIRVSSLFRAWYPTVIGESDTLGGQTVRLYYADFIDSSRRNLVSTDIRFKRND